MALMKSIHRFYINYGRSAGIMMLFLLTAMTVIYLFPREGKFRFEYQKGKPWMHETLIAPFSFPIYKPEGELQAERDSVLRNFNPYFYLDTTVWIAVEEEFLSKMEADWETFHKQSWVVSFTDRLGITSLNIQLNELRDKHKDLVLAYFRGIYNTGIIDPEAYDKGELSGDEAQIFVIRDNIGQKQTLKELHTQKSAYESLTRYIGVSQSPVAGSLEAKVIQFFNGFDYNEYILPNVFYDEDNSNRVRESFLGEISQARGMIQSGERIVSKGDLISGQTFLVLESLRREYEIKFGGLNLNLLILGQSILVIVSFLVLYLFLYNFRREILNNIRKTTFILFMLLIAIGISMFVLRLNILNYYAIPFAILPIIIRTFYDERLALFVHTIGLLLVGFFVPNGFEFIFLNFIVGIVAIFSLTNIHRRSKLFYSAIIIVFTYSILYFAIDLIKERSLLTINWANLAWFGGNGLLVLTSYPLIYFFEKTFGFLSDATLMELSDTNQPLLRKLAEEAPGTFQHSLQVANLAEAAIYKIGGNPLLVRTGALYHDIGKMVNPKYFIENQTVGLNPHDSLEYEESAKIIISHVRDGVELARKHNLPAQIIEFIQTHHGNSRVQYFYRSYLNKHTNEKVDAKLFTYPGPKPASKETAVLMMADSVEAASRSLKEPDEETLDQLVESIINFQMIEEQFTEADITYRDISTIKKIFKNKLRNIYHIRIAYPE